MNGHRHRTEECYCSRFGGLIFFKTSLTSATVDLVVIDNGAMLYGNEDAEDAEDRESSDPRDSNGVHPRVIEMCKRLNDYGVGVLVAHVPRREERAR